MTLWNELNCMDGEEEALITAIREEFLYPPSTEGYNRSSSSSSSSSSCTSISSPSSSTHGSHRSMIPELDPTNRGTYYYSQFGQVSGLTTKETNSTY